MKMGLFNRKSSKESRRADAAETTLYRVHKELTGRMDLFSNPITGMRRGNSKACADRWSFVPELSIGVLDNMYESNALVARVIDLVPDYATGKGYAISGLDRRDQDAMDDFLEGINYSEIHSDALRWARLYGGAGMVMRINDGRAPEEPINMTGIDSLHSLQSFDRNQLTVERWNSDPTSSLFGQPESYRLSVEGISQIIHASRVLPQNGGRRTWTRRRVNGGWGVSVVQQFHSAFNMYLSTHQYLMESIMELIQGVLKVQGYNKSATSEHRKDILKRIAEVFQRKSSIGDMVLDKDGEDYQMVARNITGYRDALEAFTDHFVANSGIPKTILMGTTPGGLTGGSNEGDWKALSSFTSAFQKRDMRRNIIRLTDVILRSKASPVIDVPERWTIKFNPLWELSETEAAEVHLKNAQSREVDVRSQIISPDEGRRQGDVKESYELTEKEIIKSEEDSDKRTKDISSASFDAKPDMIRDVEEFVEQLTSGRLSKSDGIEKLDSIFGIGQDSAAQIMGRI